MHMCSDMKRSEIMCICYNLCFRWMCLLAFVPMSAAVISAGKMKQHYSLDGQNLSRLERDFISCFNLVQILKSLPYTFPVLFLDLIWL